jgi:uncharacterized protein YcfJ
MLYRFTLILLSVFVVACSQTPTVGTDQLSMSANAVVVEGVVVSTQTKKTAASGSEQAVGALIGVGIGSLFGSGKGKAVAAVAGGALGDAATNHFYGEEVESMTVKLENGQFISVDVKGNPFNAQDRVKVSMQGGSVTGIVHDYD